MKYISVFEKFEIDSTTFVDFDIIDNQNTSVPIEDLAGLISQNYRCAEFFIQLSIDGQIALSKTEVTSIRFGFNQHVYITYKKSILKSFS